MIYVGIDDTDMPDTPGTNQLGKVLIALVADRFRCRFLLRHQLFFDPRVPYTSKNGSASIWLTPRDAAPRDESAEDLAALIARLKARMLEWYVPGSDPGLCVTTSVPDEVTQFAHRCQREVVTRDEAESLAARHGLHLEGLGGTRGGMIGALAAVGLAVTQDDGRVVVHGEWSDDLCGVQPVAAIASRGILVRSDQTGEAVTEGEIDVGKHLRPNLRDGRVVLFAEQIEIPDGPAWRAVRKT